MTRHAITVTVGTATTITVGSSAVRGRALLVTQSGRRQIGAHPTRAQLGELLDAIIARRAQMGAGS